MFTTKLVISGLKRQNRLIEEIIEQLEGKDRLGWDDVSFYEEKTKSITRNLRSLRHIKDQYALFIESMANLD